MLTAIGPGAEQFHGHVDNTFVIPGYRDRARSIGATALEAPGYRDPECRLGGPEFPVRPPTIDLPIGCVLCTCKTRTARIKQGINALQEVGQ